MKAIKPALFNTVTDDHLELFDKKGRVRGEKVVHIFDYKKDDISSATNVPRASIRYDDKMPEELRQRLQEWANVLNLVAEFFKDNNKTILWFQTPNPLLGGISPRDMIRVGRFKKLLKFIQTALDENQS